MIRIKIMRKLFPKIVFCFLFLLLTGGIFVSSGETSETSISGLFVNEQAYNNKEVIVQGEVLDVLSQKTGRWINLREKNAAIGVWCGKDVKLPEIEHFTGFNQRGDVIKVRGIFHSSCPDHWGEKDIHALFVHVVRKGFRIEEEVPSEKIKLVFLWGCLFAASFVFFAAGKLREKYRRPN